jgi:hypothetical protein
MTFKQIFGLSPVRLRRRLQTRAWMRTQVGDRKVELRLIPVAEVPTGWLEAAAKHAGEQGFLICWQPPCWYLGEERFVSDAYN